MSETIKKVAQHLRNTVAVCRSYYIHPTIIATYNKQELVPYFKKAISSKKKANGLTKNESAVASLLKNYS